MVPVVVKTSPRRRPSRHFIPAFILFYSFSGLVILGGLLLTLPFSSTGDGFTPLDLAYFTATSAVTVTGLTVVDTATYWTDFGKVVIFALMLIGGLGFTSLATFFLIVIGQRITLPERMLMRDTMGVDRLGGIVPLLRNIILIVTLIYLVGGILIWWRLQGEFSTGESIWQSAFLSVSAFNNAGFSILPDSMSLSRFFDDIPLLVVLAALIVLGGIGWTVLVDVFRQHRFSRFALDTKMVIATSMFLWALGAAVLFIAEFDNENTLGASSLGMKTVHSIFHSISGRTAGLTTIDVGQTTQLHDLFYPMLMFIGGTAGSVAGGIKVATIAVIISAVVSSVRGRLQAEAFGREIPHFQVHRALTVAALGMVIVFAICLGLTLTERSNNIPFLDLFFDAVSAFGTTGLSTGVPEQLSTSGKVLFMITMMVGRLGPLTLALALTPRQEASVYRFVQERVKIG